MTSSVLYQRVVASFAKVFGGAPAMVIRAPGRVNLIGEHTDYNDGFVLPCAINFQTLAAIAPRNDSTVRVVACDYGDAIDEFDLDGDIAHLPNLPWANYVRGVLVMLRRAGMTARGANLAIGGDVPQGAGLSSSASLEVAVATAFKYAFDLHGLDATDIARIAQRAENEFVGCNCGIMDQLISARGSCGHALLIDCRSLLVKPVLVPPNVAVMIVHSNIKRGLVDSEYNLRRQQCEAAAAHFGVAKLRDVSLQTLQDRGARLDPVTFRRARHVITENARTLAAFDALAAGDLRQMGKLMAQSHDSMRDDFDITVPAIDRLVKILQDTIGADGGARMTGGGFGGCAVALMPETKVIEVSDAVLQLYKSADGHAATIYVCKPEDGAGVLQK